MRRKAATGLTGINRLAIANGCEYLKSYKGIPYYYNSHYFGTNNRSSADAFKVALMGKTNSRQIPEIRTTSPFPDKHKQYNYYIIVPGSYEK